MQIRVITWNMNRRSRADEAWAYLRSMEPDIILLQEARRPHDTEEALWHDVWGKGWGTAVVVRDRLRLREIPSVRVGGTAAIPEGHLERSHPGAWVAAEVDIPDVGPVTAISVYGVQCKLSNGVTYATTSVQRTLSDLTPLLDVNRSKGRIVLGGDLNVSPQIDPPDTGAHVAIFERFKAFGLVDVLGATHSGHVRTYRHQNKTDSKPWQLDWVFASKAMKITACEPRDVEEAWSLSDHCPVVTDLDV